MKKTKQIPKHQIIAKFEEFLKENNCYEEFVENLKLNDGMSNLDLFYRTYNKASNFDDLISGAFQWDQSEQGHYFGIGLNNKWIYRYEELISEEN